jgi:hypothetical protein
MKSSQTRVRINQDNTETLRKLADQTGLQQIDVATMLLHSALNAVREHHGQVPMVVKFKIEKDQSGK